MREAVRWHGETHAQWRQAFWNAYLELACRWADLDAFGLALEQGAKPAQIMPIALKDLAEGIHSLAMDAPYYTEGLSNAHYLAVLDRLCATGCDLRQESATVLIAAARVDNRDILEQLVARGADLTVAGPQALAAVAANVARDAVEWLLAHGVDSPEALDKALLEAVATLDDTLTETLLDAGADIHAGGDQALCTACSAQPTELYNGQTGFVSHRADMILLLARRGANLEHPRFTASLQLADQGDDVLSDILGRQGLETQYRLALATVGASAFGWLSE